MEGGAGGGVDWVWVGGVSSQGEDGADVSVASMCSLIVCGSIKNMISHILLRYTSEYSEAVIV